MSTKAEQEEAARTSLKGNTFIVIPKGTIITTDDPKFPVVRLVEDLRVCSNAKAEVAPFVMTDILGCDVCCFLRRLLS